MFAPLEREIFNLFGPRLAGLKPLQTRMWAERLNCNVTCSGAGAERCAYSAKVPRQMDRSGNGLSDVSGIGKTQLKIG